MFRRRGLVPSLVAAVPLLYGKVFTHSHTDTEAPSPRDAAPRGILFLGTGSSSSTPLAFELMQPEKVSALRREVSQRATIGDPRNHKNYRCNPSLMLRFDGKNVVIDAGKTFRESIIRWFPEHGVRTVDGIVLTHGHADAIFGLDDIRTLQGPGSDSMDVFLSKDCFEVVARVFSYLLPAPASEGAVRKVSSVSFRFIEEYQPFEVAGLTLLPVPVMHGEDLKCMGFIFGREEKVCYLSDISRMLPATLDKIKENKIDLLIVDALFISSPHPFHYSLKQAIELVKQIRPRRARFVGMTSEFDYDVVNLELLELSRSEGIDMQLAYDGLFMNVDI